MADCELCMAMQGGEAVVFEDGRAVAMLHPRGAAPGHLIVMPRAHHGIMEQVPDEELRHLFRVARLMAESLEKGIGCRDLDVIIANGPAAGQEFPHFSIHIIPRGKGDSVKIGWNPADIPAQEMDSIEAMLKEACSKLKPAEQKTEALETEKKPAPESYARRVVRIP